MRERLRDLITEMVDAQRAMGAAATAARADPARRVELVAVRRKFSALVAQVDKAIERDPQMLADAPLAREFRARFDAMRRGIAVHQAKYPAVLLANDSPEFQASADTVIHTNRAFAGWALEVLV